jgi:hypothetical protein
MPAAKTGKDKKAKTFADPKANPVIKALIKGRKTSPVVMDYLRVMEGDRSYGQLAARRDYSILENLRDDVRVAGLDPAGKSGAVRGRWHVTEKDIAAATKALDASREIVKRELAEAKTKASRSKATSKGKSSTKDRVLSGSLASVAAANPDLAAKGKDVRPARKTVGVEVEA